jgi:hypothetical protein
LVLCFRTSGSELEPPTAQAYEEYVKTAQARMQNEVSDPGHFLIASPEFSAEML